jgi:hypothetical protein
MTDFGVLVENLSIGESNQTRSWCRSQDNGG